MSIVFTDLFYSKLSAVTGLDTEPEIFGVVAVRFASSSLPTHLNLVTTTMRFTLLLGLASVAAVSASAQHRLVADIIPGANSSQPAFLTSFNGAVYFVANGEDEFHYSRYVYYVYSYVPGGEVVRVSGVVSRGYLGRLQRLAVYDGALYFPGEVLGTADVELLRYRPEMGVELAADLLEGENGYGSQVSSLTVVGDVLYFAARGRLWRYTEVDGPSVVWEDFLVDHVLYASEDQDALYVSNGGNSRGLFRYTPETGMQRVDTGDIRYNLYDAFDYDGSTYFPEFTGQRQQVQRLWRHNADDGLTLAIEADPNPTSDEGGRWKKVAEHDGDLYLSASRGDASFGSHTLWRYTSDGDLEVVGFPEMEFAPGVAYDGSLYFSGFKEEIGFELWRYTPGSEPELVANIHQGASSSHPGGFAVLGDTLYFTALESQTGWELYAYSAAPKVTSVGDGPEGEFGLAVSPNPSSGPVDIRLSAETGSSVRVSVFDAVGREVSVLYDGVARGEMQFRLERGPLPPGTYIVRVSSAGSSANRTFTVAR
ncbi:T9SS type A sorting domain-containing protein [Rubrivirga sp.]|uniref:T9SS type A sorting domain-containing protein n=1 Tax=Rubrivirga sp. TaxID=1885344 RepID=UPI003C78B330